MRTVQIIRPKRMDSAALKFKVSVDGEKAGALANGREITLQLDESAHVIEGKGGALSGKSFAFRRMIPQGGYSYIFQIDLHAAGSNSLPLLRPTDGQRLKDDMRIRTQIAVDTMELLMNEEHRAWFRANPGVCVRLWIGEEKWGLAAVQGEQQQVLLEKDYSGMQIVGFAANFIAASLEKSISDTEEHRQETLRHIFDQYFRFLPDYEIVGEDLLHFRG